MHPASLRSIGAGMEGMTLLTSLLELAARVQRGRTLQDVLRVAGDGLDALGMRFIAFQLDGSELVLRHLATASSRLAAVEQMIGCKLHGLRAPLDQCPPVREVIRGRKILVREDLDVFERFLIAATGYDPTPLDGAPATAGIANGVLAPIFVREQPWGLLSVVSQDFRRADATGVALFAAQVGSALEVAEYIEALGRAQKELVDRERLAALGELSAIVAHEVRNPLGAIFASVAGLRRVLRAAGPFPSVGDADVLVGVLDEEAQRLNEIVSDLLAFAQPTPVRRSRSSLGELVKDVALSAAARPEASVVEIEVDVDPELPSVFMDRRLLRQALYNVVLNALQAMPRGGTLTVRARKEPRGDDTLACVDVSDTGVGIREEDAGRVFEPFFTTKATGTGLGLPLVKRVVDAHGGVVSFVSNSSGTTFTVGVPVHGTAWSQRRVHEP